MRQRCVTERTQRDAIRWGFLLTLFTLHSSLAASQLVCLIRRVHTAASLRQDLNVRQQTSASFVCLLTSILQHQPSSQNLVLLLLEKAEQCSCSVYLCVRSATQICEISRQSMISLLNYLRMLDLQRHISMTITVSGRTVHSLEMEIGVAVIRSQRRYW